MSDVNRRLSEDLCAPRYKITSDRILKVEAKDDIRRRLGRSTDYGDALVYAVANLNKHRRKFETGLKLPDGGTKSAPWITSS